MCRAVISCSHSSPFSFKTLLSVRWKKVSKQWVDIASKVAYGQPAFSNPPGQGTIAFLTVRVPRLKRDTTQLSDAAATYGSGVCDFAP
jgi:hypothetical protein